jgi:guanyl-specific ribonuclease Sa
MRKPIMPMLLLLIGGLWIGAATMTAHAAQRHPPDATLPAFLPPEAADTLQRIAHGGPFAHAQDGSVFGNREGQLPRAPQGYYREYTVETPGLGSRGARRIISGGMPPTIYYYTADHYQTFRAFRVTP